MEQGAVVKELPLKLTDEEALRQIIAENEAVGGEPVVKAQLTEVPVDGIPPIPTDEPKELTEEQKAEITARLQAAQQEFHSMVQYIETKYGVKFIQQVGFQVDLPKG